MECDKNYQHLAKTFPKFKKSTSFCKLLKHKRDASTNGAITRFFMVVNLLDRLRNFAAIYGLPEA